MLEETQNVYKKSKKSLETLLREKAYLDVKANLKSKDINIEDISDEDLETLVAAKTKDIKNGIKGFSVGAAFSIALSLLIGL